MNAFPSTRAAPLKLDTLSRDQGTHGGYPGGDPGGDGFRPTHKCEWLAAGSCRPTATSITGPCRPGNFGGYNQGRAQDFIRGRGVHLLNVHKMVGLPRYHLQFRASDRRFSVKLLIYPDIGPTLNHQLSEATLNLLIDLTGFFLMKMGVGPRGPLDPRLVIVG